MFFTIQNRLIFPGAATQGHPAAEFHPDPDTPLVRLTTARGDRVVDQVEVDFGAAVERRAAEPDGRVEVGMLGRRRNHETKLALRQLHDGAERSIHREERQ